MGSLQSQGGSALDTVLEVDGSAVAARFAGFGRPLEVALSDGGTARLRPWRYRDQLDALRACLDPDGDRRLTLDPGTLARFVLRRLDLAHAEELAGVALWWAGGGLGPAADPLPAGGGWVDLGETRAWLRGWSNGERLVSLARRVRSGGAGAGGQGESLDVVGYLDDMVRASLRALDPPAELEALDAAATAALLEAVVQLNAPDTPLSEPLGGDPGLLRELASSTLRLCAALGWTPSRVWSTPAAEVDRLLALLDLTGPQDAPAATPEPPGTSELERHPDAVVIHFEAD